MGNHKLGYLIFLLYKCQILLFNYFFFFSNFKTWHFLYDQGNESDVGNIDFDIQAKNRWQILLMFYIVFELQRILHISATRCPVNMGLGSKCSMLNDQVIDIGISKIKTANMWLIPLMVAHFISYFFPEMHSLVLILEIF